MTEDEAKTKWCPMIQVTAVQHFNDVEYGDNRGDGDSNHNCIASDCMMWVWGKTEALKHHDRSEPEVIKHGYCGLTK